tara:strand:+ start:331 stop:489 length:159 start_codon:yes stop_codon:yes gene_type:complete
MQTMKDKHSIPALSDKNCFSLKKLRLLVVNVAVNLRIIFLIPKKTNQKKELK